MVRLSFVLATCGLLAACGGGGEAPTGQVVATVGGQEITSAQLNLELAGATGGTPAEQQARRQAALQAIVDRTILAQAAREEGLDDTPTFAMLRDRAEQSVLIDLLARGGGTVPTVGDQEVAAFVESNPDRFAERKLFLVNQINVPSTDPAVLRALQPVTTMDGAREVLRSRNIAFGETVGVVDTLEVPPEAARQLAQLTPGTVFLTPDPTVIHVNQLREVQDQPITGETANRAARAIMEAERGQGLGGRRIESILKAGRGTVRYNDEFKPTPAGRPAAPAQPPR